MGRVPGGSFVKPGRSVEEERTLSTLLGSISLHSRGPVVMSNCSPESRFQRAGRAILDMEISASL